MESGDARQSVQSATGPVGISSFGEPARAGGSLACSDRVRARAIARARAALASDASTSPVVPAQRRPRLYFGASVCLAFGLGVVGAVVHDGRGAHLGVAPALPDVAAPPLHAAERQPPATIPPVPPDSAGPRRHGRGSAAVVIPPSACSSEGECLKLIWKAFSDQDYRSALAGVSEHRRRFPNGQLREEREALQVLSLAGAGHTDQARQASAVFGEHFPGSVLSPKIRQAVGTD